jgi:hypothetical protein
VPEYKTPHFTFRVDDISSNECPVSQITPESRWLVQLLSKNTRINRGTSAPMYGMDSGLWPAWWYDAVDIAQYVSDLEESAADKERARKQERH